MFSFIFMICEMYVCSSMFVVLGNVLNKKKFKIDDLLKKKFLMNVFRFFN